VQQVLGLRIVGPAEDDADARGRDDILAFERNRHGEGVLDAPRGALPVGQSGDFVEQQRELVAPEPRHDVARPNAGAQPSGDLRQEAVAGGVAKAVVHRLEAVHVEE